MYAIVEINGQQFKAEAGQKLFVHHIQNAENGATVEFDKVLLVDKDGNVTVGAPTVDGAKVVCQIVSSLVKGDKVLVFHIPEPPKIKIFAIIIFLLEKLTALY